jgi:hypothetical protein
MKRRGSDDFEAGKEYFVPGEECSYHYLIYAGLRQISALYEFDARRDFFTAGWNEAKRIYEMEHNEENKFKMFSDNCPWHDRSHAPSTKCMAISKECSKENCALIYLKENYVGI